MSSPKTGAELAWVDEYAPSGERVQRKRGSGVRRAGPHVRIEMRKAFVTDSGSASLNKHAVYVRLAKKMIADACHCHEERDVNWREVCRFHEACGCREVMTEYGPVDCGHGMPHYVRVKERLIRFLKFVDTRMRGELTPRQKLARRAMRMRFAVRPPKPEPIHLLNAVRRYAAGK